MAITLPFPASRHRPFPAMAGLLLAISGSLVSIHYVSAARARREEHAMLRFDRALGATVEPFSDTGLDFVADSESEPEGLVVVSVAAKGTHTSPRLAVGDIIERIGNRPARSRSDVAAALAADAARPARVPLMVWRHEREFATAMGAR